MHMRAAQDRQADDVGILLERGRRDLLGSLAEAHVNDLHPRVTERAGDDLGPTVVPVEAWLGDDNPRFSHARFCTPLPLTALGASYKLQVPCLSRLRRPATKSVTGARKTLRGLHFPLRVPTSDVASDGRHFL